MVSTARKPLYTHLYFQVVCAILIGILLGHFYPAMGNGVATVVVAKWENALDMARLQRHLAGTSEPAADAPQKALA